MRNNRNILIKVIQWLLGILLIGGIVLVAVFPFHSRDLRLRFITEGGELDLLASVDAINEHRLQDLNFEQTNELKIKELRIYGDIDSMYLEKIGFNQFGGLVTEIKDGVMHWEEDGILFKGNDGIHLVMDESFYVLLKGNSSSLLLERIILAELFAVIIVLCLVGLKVIEEKTDISNRDNHSPIYEMKKFMGDIRKYWQYTVYAAKTDLKAEVANSYLNRLWWLLEPFFNMLVYVLVFGKVMGNSIQNYATFVFSALLMWNFFNKTINYSVKLVRNNKDIVTKVYLPKFILLISNMILNMFKLFFSLTVLAVMLIVFKVHIGINVLWVLPAYVVMILLAFGGGMIFLHFGVYVDDLS